VLELELVDDEPVELEWVLDEEEVVVVVPAGVAHVWLTPRTGSGVRLCGSALAPAGSETLNTSCCPPATVIVTVQGSVAASATGIATSPPTTAQNIAAATLSFVRMDTGLIPPTSDVRHLQKDPLMRDRRRDATGCTWGLQRGTVW
jgi:hypothetical protein